VRALRALVAAGAGAAALVATGPLVILGLPFAIVAVLTRRVARRLERPHVAWPELIAFDPTVGWKPRPCARADHLADDVFHAATDADGWRGTRSVTESDVVVFGDSFAWGYGIDDEDFFGNLNRDVRVKAIGINGYNMVQELLWMERLSAELRGKLVVWFIYLGNDLYENLAPHMWGYRMPFMRGTGNRGGWEIVTSHLSPARLPYRADGRVYYERLAELCSPSFLAERAYAACEFLLAKGRDVCARVDARLLVMTIPDSTQLTAAGTRWLLSCGGDPKSFDPDFPDKKIRDICERLGPPFVALKDHLDASHYKERDCHWNRSGHRRVAEVLADVCRADAGRRRESAAVRRRVG